MFDNLFEYCYHDFLCLVVILLEVFSFDSFCVSGFPSFKTVDRRLNLLFREIRDVLVFVLVVLFAVNFSRDVVLVFNPFFFILQIAASVGNRFFVFFVFVRLVDFVGVEVAVEFCERVRSVFS